MKKIAYLFLATIVLLGCEKQAEWTVDESGKDIVHN